MKAFLKFATFVTLGLFAVNAQAGMHIEPYIGYDTGKILNTLTNGGTILPESEEDYTGSAYGLRLGYSMIMFSLGVEYQGASGTGEDSLTKAETDYDFTDLGIFVGIDLPVMLRFYATYFVSSKASIDGATEDPEGVGYKVGVGFTFLPLVSLNLEVMARDFDDSTVLTGPPLITSDAKSATTMLTLSLPL